MQQQLGQYRPLNFSEVPQPLGQQAIFAPIGSDADVTAIEGDVSAIDGRVTALEAGETLSRAKGRFVYG